MNERNTEYFFYGFCHLRKASLPIEEIFKLNDLLIQKLGDSESSFISIIESLYDSFLFEEAIYTTSEDLHALYFKLKSAEKTDLNDIRKYFITMYKYFSRICCRGTPFGLFAGSGSILIDNNTELTAGQNKNKVDLQFNIFPILNILRNVHLDAPKLINSLKYYTNNTLYALDDRVYYVEQLVKDGALASNLTSVAKTPYVERIIAVAHKGATVEELITQLNDVNIDKERKIDFINKLIENQIIVTELWPSVSSDDFMGDLLSKIKDKKVVSKEFENIEALYHVLKQTEHMDDIKRLRQHLKNNQPMLGFKIEDWIKVDLYNDWGRSTISNAVIEEIAGASYDLLSLTPIYEGSESLKVFVESFLEKYGDGEVPLTQALDPNYGVGYSSVVNGYFEYMPLIEDLPLPNQNSTVTEYTRDSFDEVRKRAYQKGLRDGLLVVQIDKDVETLLNRNMGDQKEFIKTSTFLFGGLLSDSVESLNALDFKFICRQLHTPFAANLLTRFAKGDEMINSKLNLIARDEQNLTDCVIAEVVTIPDGGYANVTLRPRIRDYEIPYISRSSLSNEKQIEINDLYVSVKNNQVVLRSKRLDKVIIPYMSTSYNASRGLPVYKFLSNLSARQIRHGFNWNWREFSNESFLPRIEYKKLILSRATWKLKKNNAHFNFEEAYSYMSSIRKQMNLPRFVSLVELDHELFLDLETTASCYILLKELAKKDVVLLEFLHTPENCFLKDEYGSYVTEITVPMGKKNSTSSFNEKNYKDGVDHKNETFPPGSEWLFIKVYGGSKLIEKLLLELIYPYCEELRKQNVIDKWFFIRYGDPKYHLRVRFHKSANEQKYVEWCCILENLQRRLHDYIEKKYIKLQVDTYTRELERYRMQKIEFSETLFFIDSLAACKFLSLIDGESGEHLRWQFAIYSIDCLLNDFDYELSDKVKILDKLNRAFLLEFSRQNKVSSFLLKKLNGVYRNYKDLINALFADKIDESDWAELYNCFSERSEKIKGELICARRMNGSERDEFLVSHIHMAMVRIFLNNNRKHELVVYHLLKSYYRSEIEKQKISNLIKNSI